VFKNKLRTILTSIEEQSLKFFCYKNKYLQLWTYKREASAMQLANAFCFIRIHLTFKTATSVPRCMSTSYKQNSIIYCIMSVLTLFSFLTVADSIYKMSWIRETMQNALSFHFSRHIVHFLPQTIRFAPKDFMCLLLRKNARFVCLWKRQCLEVWTGSHFQFPGGSNNVIILSGLLYLSTSCLNLTILNVEKGLQPLH